MQLRHYKRFDEFVGGPRVERQGVAQRQEIRTLVQVLLFQPVPSGVEIRLDRFQRGFQDPALFRVQILFHVLAGKKQKITFRHRAQGEITIRERLPSLPSERS